MNLLLDFWNNRLPTARSRSVDRRFEPACPSENVRGVFWVRPVRTEDRSIILISRGVGSVVPSSAFCSGSTDVWTAICHARRAKNPARGIYFKSTRRREHQWHCGTTIINREISRCRPRLIRAHYTCIMRRLTALLISQWVVVGVQERKRDCLLGNKRSRAPKMLSSVAERGLCSNVAKVQIRVC